MLARSSKPQIFKWAAKVVLVVLPLQLLIFGRWERFTKSGAVTRAQIAAI